MSKIPLLAAFGAGYVLGAHAGRERYEQIASGARKVARDPRVQSAASKAQDTVTTQASAVAGVAKDKVTDKVKDKTSSTKSNVADGGSNEPWVQPATDDGRTDSWVQPAP